VPRFTKAAFAALGLLATAHGAFGDAFGRFGFLQQLDLPGVVVTRAGFRAKSPHASNFAFLQRSKEWAAAVTTDTGQTVVLQTAPKCPRKLAANLYAPGFQLFIDDNFALNNSSQGTPYLTWNDGSVAPGVPTPDLHYVILSFSDAEPPLLVVLPGNTKGSFQVAGKPGAWQLSVEQSVKGWVHVCYPFGDDEIAASTAGDLGRVAMKLHPNEAFFTGDTPQLQSVDIEANDDSVTATWKFSGPFLVPPAVISAPIGGYPLELDSGYEPLGGATENGPLWESKGNSLRIKFPCRRIGPGRPISLVGDARVMPGTVSAIDAPSIVDLAIEALRGDRDPACLPLAQDAEQTYLSGAEFSMELWTHATVSYNAENVGLDLTAAYGLLMQSLSLDSVRPPDNAFLTSVMWRTDWLTWMPFDDTADKDSNRRAATYASVASCINSSPSVRLAGAMLEAGLAAERGVALKRQHDAKTPHAFLEPMIGIREALFSATFPGATETPATLFFGKVRVLSAIQVSARHDVGGDVLVVANPTGKPFNLVLSSAPGADFAAGDNVASLAAHPGEEGVVHLVISPKGPGPCILKIAGGEAPQGATSTLPMYQESRR
jgi:hypothetical protein